MRTIGYVLGVFLQLVVTAAGAAQVDGKEAAIDREDQKVMGTYAFLYAHPDLRYRIEGWKAFDGGRFEDAIAHFTRAASFGDKLSQAMLAEMAWKGQGQDLNRPLAYAWADLSAERGYRQFVLLREQYWSQLTADERKRTIEAGQPLLPLYSDAVTQVALQEHLRNARRDMASGRYNRGADVMVPGPGRLLTLIRGHDFYAEKFWNPKRYREWTDAVWMDPPEENVDVGEPATIGRTE